MSADLPPAPRHVPASSLIRSGAELVHLAEELYVRLFVMVLWLTVAGCAISLWFGGIVAARDPTLLTSIVAAGGFGLAVTGLIRPREAYRWLRYDRLHQLAPGF